MTAKDTKDKLKLLAFLASFAVTTHLIGTQVQMGTQVQ
jgi:hypothetical protein